MPLSMDPFRDMGRMLIMVGILIVVLGAVLFFGARAPGRLGRLPGDIVYRRGNFTFYFPLITCIILSIILTLILRFFFRR